MQLIIGVAALIVIVLIIGWLQDNKERQRIARVRREAERLELEFREEGDPGVLRETVPFLLFYQGTSSAIRNVMLAERRVGHEDGPDLAAFEYAFYVPYGRHVQCWRQTVIQLISTSLFLPDFSAMPHPVFEALATKARDEKVRELALTTPRVSFDDRPEFAEQTLVHGSDRERVRALFSDALIRYFKDRPGLCVEAGERVLILYRFDDLKPADGLAGFLDDAYELHRLLKEASQ
jgi:hypothetical protein